MDKIVAKIGLATWGNVYCVWKWRVG